MASFVLEPKTLLIFLDETGHEKLADPNYPILGIGGCAVLGSMYEQTIVTPWKRLKADNFGNPDIALHATDLKGLTPDQLQAFDLFFTTNPFFRLASVLKITTVVPDKLTYYNLIALSVFQRIQEIASRINFDAVKLVFEASERLDSLVIENFGGMRMFDELEQEIPVYKYFMPKSLKESGLEVADFIIHTAGGQANNRLKGKSGFRKDFESIFRKVSPQLISYIEINTATLPLNE